MTMQDFNITVGNAEKVLDESGKLLHWYYSRENQRRMKKLYSSRRAMKRVIRKQENSLAITLTNLDGSANDAKDGLQIESDMEWFLTWAVKLSGYPEAMWCDGVVDLQLRLRDKRTYSVQAKIWIGPERDVSIQYLCDLNGTITLNQNRQRLKSYRLEISDKGKTYLVRKAT